MTETDRLEALGRLMAVIHAEVEAGERVPCIDPHRGYLWLAEGREEREAAAFGCSTCPALGACSQYVAAHPEPSGVWAGRVPRTRKEVTA